MNKLVGSRIRQARKEMGLTQAELADSLGCHPSLVTKMEKGDSSVTLKNLFGLPRALYKPLEHFLGLDMGLSEDEMEWLAIYQSLPEMERRYWRTTLRAWLRERDENVGE